MRFAVTVATYANPSVTAQTVADIKSHLTDQVVTVVDAKGWHLFNNVDCDLIRGQPHGLPFNSHLNQIIGLNHTFNTFDADWYGHVEWDVLIRGNVLKQDLETTSKDNWMAGFDLREWEAPWPFLSEKIGIKIEKTRYVLGCCQFYRRHFLESLWKTGFVREIVKSSGFWRDKWPDYKEYSTDEAIIPSVCRAMGGGVLDLKGDKYAVRYRPVWTELPDAAEVIHPVKSRG